MRNLWTRARAKYLNFSPTDFIITLENYCRRIQSGQTERIEWKEFYFVRGRPELLRERQINFLVIIGIICINYIS